MVAVHTYDPCFSATINWGATHPDRRLTWALADGRSASVTSSAALAGAIASVQIDGVEMIDSGGHGAAFQWALHGTHPLKPVSITRTSSECYNPTQAGNMYDDHVDLQGNWLNQPVAPYHGPSTSWIGESSPTLTNGAAGIRTLNRPAYYVPHGWKSLWDGCEGNYPTNTSPYYTNLSRFLVVTEVEASPCLPMDARNVVRVQMRATAEAEEHDNRWFDTIVIAYLSKDLSNAYEVEPGKAQPTALGNERITTNPLILSNGSTRAVGVIGRPPTTTGAPSTYHQEPPYVYLQVAPATPEYPFDRRTLQVTFWAEHVAGGTVLNYETLWVLGSVQQVHDTLQALVASP
jgi:hypothetical protein